MVGPGRFVVENGLLKTEGGMGLLYYRGQKFGNQSIRVVFKTGSEHANSGVYIRMPDPPSDPWYGVHNGYEVQIDAAGDEWHCTGALYSLSKASKRTQKPMGEWNTMDIQLEGQVTRVFLNGEKVNEFKGDQAVPERKQWYEPIRGPRADSGYIGLQNHDARSTVYFKEVSVLNGNVTPLGEELTKSDRDQAMSYLHATRKQILDAVTGLTPAQWTYKAGPDRWSIAEIMEHLALAETGIFDFAQAGLKGNTPPPSKAASDTDFVNMIKDRSKPAKAPEMFQPKGRWKAGAEVVKEFSDRRERTIMLVERSHDDWRGHYVNGPAGTLSAYQMMLLIPSHNERHLQQINEVKASAGYPK